VSVMETASDKNRNSVELNRFDDQVFDDPMGGISPLAIVFALNAEWAHVMPKLEKVGLLQRSAWPDIFWRRCLLIAAGHLRLVEMKAKYFGPFAFTPTPMVRLGSMLKIWVSSLRKFGA
jgi:hypothetical protein